jgi:integrase
VCACSEGRGRRRLRRKPSKIPRTTCGRSPRAGTRVRPPPHMFRHACGFLLANQGTDTRILQAYLGHRNIQHTVRYTERSPARFKNPLARLNIVSAMTCGLRVTRRRWHSGTGTKR